jgi:hypothetical protein
MPICVNPKCGQVSKTMSLYCPSCGQQSLSRVDRGQVESPHSLEISMENFDRIAKDVPAKREIPYGLPKSNKHVRNYSRKQKTRKTNFQMQKQNVSGIFSLISIILGVVGITIGLADLASINQGTTLFLLDSELRILLLLNLGSSGMAIAAYFRRQAFWKSAFSIALIAVFIFIACLKYDLASIFNI